MKFIKGEIYNVNEDGNKNIFMWGDGDSSSYIHVEATVFAPRGAGNFACCEKTAIEASPQEKQWLLNCIAARNYVKKPKILYYEIY